MQIQKLPARMALAHSTGYYTDTETGLILCSLRYYDPQAGRWLTEDPIGIAGGLNLYAYCANSPANYVDPSGLSPEWNMLWQVPKAIGIMGVFLFN